MQYGLPQLKKYPIDTVENIQKCIKFFVHCPETLKEELANNIYKASLREGYEIDGNEDLFRYVDFNEELNETSNVPKLGTEIERNQYKKDIAEPSIVDETLVFSKKDFEQNIDDFYNGRTNVLFITGLSGSGKSTLSEEITKKYNAKHIELDKFEWNFYRPETLRNFQKDILIEYIMKRENWDNFKKAYEDMKNGKLGLFMNEFHKCFMWLLKKIETTPNQKYVVEGLQIACIIEPEIFKDKSIIIKNTSITKSIYQRFHKRKDDLEIKRIKSMMHNYFNIDKDLSILQKTLESSNSLKESCVASLAIPDSTPNEDNKYIKYSELEDFEQELYKNKNDLENSMVNENDSIKKDSFDFDNLLKEESEVLTEATKISKRKEMENLIYNFFNTIDVTGRNAENYKKQFSTLTDEQFEKFMKKFLNDDTQNFYLEVLPNKNEPNLKQIKKCADLLKIPLDEYVYYRHDGDKDQPVRTAYRVPTGYLVLKRMQQTLSKKNTYSLSISSRNMKTNQVSGHDKIA